VSELDVVDDDKLVFTKALGGYVAENHHRHYAVFSGWGWREDLQKEYFIWTLEVREKTEVSRYRTVVGQPVIYGCQARTRTKAIDEAQRFERSITEALRCQQEREKGST